MIERQNQKVLERPTLNLSQATQAPAGDLHAAFLVSTNPSKQGWYVVKKGLVGSENMAGPFRNEQEVGDALIDLRQKKL